MTTIKDVLKNMVRGFRKAQDVEPIAIKRVRRVMEAAREESLRLKTQGLKR